MESTKTAARPAYPIVGSFLHAELRSPLPSYGYCPAAIVPIVEYLESRGTGTGCPDLDPTDVPFVNALLFRAWANQESDASSWAPVFDEHIWNPTDDEPAPADEPFRPDPADQAAAAELLAEPLDWATVELIRAENAEARLAEAAFFDWVARLDADAEAGKITDFDVARTGAIG